MIERERLFRDVYMRRGCCWWKARPLATARERLLVSRPATGGGSAVRAADYTSSSHSFCAPKESQAQQHFRGEEEWEYHCPTFSKGINEMPVYLFFFYFSFVQSFAPGSLLLLQWMFLSWWRSTFFLFLTFSFLSGGFLLVVSTRWNLKNDSDQTPPTAVFILVKLCLVWKK